jgi:hypothetical protein
MRAMHVPVLSVLLGCILCSATASAAPITYTISFLDDDGAPSINPPTTGSFTYDSATATFTSFHVTWYSFVYDLTSEANAPTGSHSDPCFAGASGAVASFALLTTGACPAEWGVGNFTQGGGGSSLSFIHSTAGQLQFLDTREFNPNVPDSPGLPASNFAVWGHFSVAQVTPPGTVLEPASLLLLGTGVAAVMARRRLTKRL